MNTAQLIATARTLVVPGKGILAADESLPTIKKRLAAVNVESSAETRRTYRELLFTTKGIEEFISGVILFDETIHQRSANGQAFPDLLSQKGILPGIKVDKGTISLPAFPDEKITEGLDGLPVRLKEYGELGARFTKWRAVIAIGPSMPSAACMRDNAALLALFAALSQDAGLVPVVEPEVLMDGDHDIQQCQETTLAVLGFVFDALREHRVLLEGMLLKPNMIVSGKQAVRQATDTEVADRTIRVLRQAVPAAVQGIVFLSGGQTPEQATQRLNIMNARDSHPWQLSFSFARALQDPALKSWKGVRANTAEAQHVFYHRAKCNSLARYGTYSEQMEKLAA